MKKTITTVTLLALAIPAAAQAKSVPYAGKTSGGSSITLKRSGKKVSKIYTSVPTTCVETTGSGYSRSGAELVEPPGKFKLGKKGKVEALQPAAMNLGIRATKTYRIKVKKAGRHKVKGKIQVSFSFLVPNAFRSLPYLYSCVGSAKFTAKAT